MAAKKSKTTTRSPYLPLFEPHPPLKPEPKRLEHVCTDFDFNVGTKSVTRDEWISIYDDAVLTASYNTAYDKYPILSRRIEIDYEGCPSLVTTYEVENLDYIRQLVKYEKEYADYVVQRDAWARQRQEEQRALDSHRQNELKRELAQIEARLKEKAT